MIVEVIIRVLLTLALAGGVSTPDGDSSPKSVPAPLRGLATWYDAPSKQDAAAGPNLRRALGSDWRGSWVRVSRLTDGQVLTVTVRLTDWCACGSRNGQPTLLDLDDRAFDAVGSLGEGVIRVRVERVDGVPTKLPETSTR